LLLVVVVADLAAKHHPIVTNANPNPNWYPNRITKDNSRPLWVEKKKK